MRQSGAPPKPGSTRGTQHHPGRYICDMHCIRSRSCEKGARWMSRQVKSLGAMQRLAATGQESIPVVTALRDQTVASLVNHCSQESWVSASRWRQATGPSIRSLNVQT